MITLLLGAIAIVAGTWAGMPTLAPVLVGFAIGILNPRRGTLLAAIAGMLAWGGWLAVAAMRGEDVARFGATLGAAMGLPAWAPFLATLLYPALLASSAAWIGHLVSPRRTHSIDRVTTTRVSST